MNPLTIDLVPRPHIAFVCSDLAAEEGTMRRKTAVLLLWILALAVPRVGNQIWAQGDKKAAPEPKFKVGDVAPDFTLLDTTMNKVSLHDFRGKKNVALAFYIFAFTGG
jgi:AhpC/TSA family